MAWCWGGPLGRSMGTWLCPAGCWQGDKLHIQPGVIHACSWCFASTGLNSPTVFSDHLNGVPSPRVAILQVPKQSCPVPEPGQCCASPGFGWNLGFASMGIAGCWRCSSQKQEATARQSLRNRDTSCPGDGPCHPPVKPSTHGVHTEHGRHHSPGTKCCTKSPGGARMEPLVGLSEAVPRQGAARGEQSQRAALRLDLQHGALLERGWVMLGVAGSDSM